MARPLRLEGRGCVIVGGTGGIGRASARRFLEEGARVVITGRTDDETADAWADLNAPDRLLGLVLDGSDEKSVEAAFAQSIEWLKGRLDILFHVAGISGRRFGDGPLDQCTSEGWDRVFELNTRAVFLSNRAAVRQMLKQELDIHGLRGTIVNVGSVLATHPSPELFSTIAYAASKGAVHSLTLVSAARFAPDRIRFGLIAPSLIDTPMAQRAMRDEGIQRYLTTKQPMRSGPGLPEDCAEAALFLCEPASRFVTGAILNVDGGWCVREGEHIHE
jgi:NAD(P)-dependent dehydrogenase (short-subunit alcohol dehydrogenase family)